MGLGPALSSNELASLVSEAVNVAQYACQGGQDPRVALMFWARSNRILREFARDMGPDHVVQFCDRIIAGLKSQSPKPKEPEIPMNTFPFFRGVLVKGQHFLDAAGKAAANAVAPGDELILHAEPQNAHDCYAVAVHTQAGVRVGYLQKEVSAACAWFLAIKMPMKVTVIALAKAGNFQVNILENKP